MHTNGPVHTVIDNDRYDMRPVLHRRSELLTGHLKTTITRKSQHGFFRMGHFCRNGRRHTVAHRTTGWRYLGSKAAKTPEAMNPPGVITSAITDHHIIGQ